MDFSRDAEMRKISREAKEFFESILYDEEPLFVSDEATIWDLSTSTADELLKRCSDYYGMPLASEDFKPPLWKLIRKMNEGRRSTAF